MLSFSTNNQMIFLALEELPDSDMNKNSPAYEHGKSAKLRNFFPVSHNIEKILKGLTPYEKFFYITLCRLKNRFEHGGWFWHTDEKFGEYGFSRTKLYEMRKKLKEAGLISTRAGKTKGGQRGGTEYRLLDEL